MGSVLYIVSICCWETSSWSQVIKSHFCFQWHPSSWEGDWQLCERTCFSTGSPSTAGQLESIFSLRCPHTVVRLEFLWMWLKKVCVWATITNKLCSALQHTDQERAWPHYQNSNPDGEESPPNESLSVISNKFLVNHATWQTGVPCKGIRVGGFRGLPEPNNAFLLKLLIFQESRKHFLLFSSSFSLPSPTPPPKKFHLSKQDDCIRLKSQNGTAKKSELHSWLTPWGAELGVGEWTQRRGLWKSFIKTPNALEYQTETVIPRILF